MAELFQLDSKKPICPVTLITSWTFRGKLFETQMSDRFGFLFLFVMLFLLGLFAVINPKAAKKENADVPGFYKTGLSWMPIWGFRFVGIATLGLSGFFLYVFLTH